MTKVTVVLHGEYYWIRNIETSVVSVGFCTLTDMNRGATFLEVGSKISRHHSNYEVMMHIPFPTPDVLEELMNMVPGEPLDPPQPPLIDEEDWDDGEWEQDIYDNEDEDEWGDDEVDWGNTEDDIFNEDPGR